MKQENHTEEAEVNTEIDTIQRQEVKKIIEALLFSTDEPLPFRKLRTIVSEYLELDSKQLKELIDEYQQELRDQKRAYKLEEIAQGYILRTYPQYHSYVSLLHPSKNKDKLSQAALEVLAIIAYRHPITRAQVEAIRGVDCSSMIHTLLERELVTAEGKLEVPGRPTLYGVTKKFLLHFGLKDAKDLQDKESISEKT